MDPFPNAIWCLSWSLTGGILALSYGDNKVTLWHEQLGNKFIKLNSRTRVAPAQVCLVNEDGNCGTSNYATSTGFNSSDNMHPSPAYASNNPRLYTSRNENPPAVATASFRS